MSIRERLAKLLGVSEPDVDAAMRDERHAQRMLGRRAFLAAAAALASPIDSEPSPRTYSFIWTPPEKRVLEHAIAVTINWKSMIVMTAGMGWQHAQQKLSVTL